MKISNLNGSIRKCEGGVRVKIAAPNGQPVIVTVQKTSLIDGLRDAYGSDRHTETGFKIEDGLLMLDPATVGQFGAQPAADAAEDDDLLADDDAGALHRATPHVADDDIEDLLA